MSIPIFHDRLVQWQKQHGRHDLPWQVKSPYCVWLSEIMLQQTQVATVLDYYPRFLHRFPNVKSLAEAPQDDVLALWAGLGYYSRARNLHKAAQQVMIQFNGHFPHTRQELETLCGVGRSTAAAIAAFAFNQRETILDGNVKRVLCRVYAQEGDPQDKKFENQLWQLAEQLLPPDPQDMPSYTQGLMDLGATVCKRSKPLCQQCPMADFCEAKRQNRVEELPRKKNAIEVKTLPLYWLVLHNDKGEIFLNKRPQTGIWSGLYCVPCVENLQALYELAGQFQLDSGDLAEQTTLTHKLTHRLLMITPFTAHMPSEHVHPSDEKETLSEGLWVAPEQLADYGLPKPLFNYLNQNQKNLF